MIVRLDQSGHAAALASLAGLALPFRERHPSSTVPGIPLAPNQAIPQNAPLDDSFWIAKNSEYIARLKSSGPKPAATWFDERLAEL